MRLFMLVYSQDRLESLIWGIRMERENSTFDEENIRTSLHICSREGFPRQSWVDYLSFFFKHFTTILLTVRSGIVVLPLTRLLVKTLATEKFLNKSERGIVGGESVQLLTALHHQSTKSPSLSSPDHPSRAFIAMGIAVLGSKTAEIMLSLV